MNCTTMPTAYKHGKSSHMTLGDMVAWWERQSFTHDKGGSFNVGLYLLICKAKRNETNQATKQVHIR
jgi:hypothetical protein